MQQIYNNKVPKLSDQAPRRNTYGRVYLRKLTESYGSGYGKDYLKSKKRYGMNATNSFRSKGKFLIQ